MDELSKASAKFSGFSSTVRLEQPVQLEIHRVLSMGLRGDEGAVCCALTVRE